MAEQANDGRDAFVAGRAGAEAVGVLAVDTPCVGCGYNLRTLSTAGRCPECNRPVAESLPVSELTKPGPAALRRLARGIGWLLVGLVVAYAVSYVAVRGIAFYVLAWWLGPGGLATWYPWIWMSASLGPYLIGLLAAGRGVWLLTEPETRRILPTGLERTVRQRSKAYVCVALALIALGVIANLLVQVSPALYGVVHGLSHGAGWVFFWLALAKLLAVLRRMNALADPSRQGAARRISRLLMLAVIVYGALEIVHRFGTLIRIFGPVSVVVGLPLVEAATWLVGAVMALAWVVWGVWAWRLRGRIRRVAAAGE